MKFYIDSKGGLGFNLALARFIQSDTDNSYKVLSPYWDVFKAAGIDVYKPNEMRDFIFDAEKDNAEIVEHRIYDMSDFIKKKLDYQKAWAKLLDVHPKENPNKLNLDVSVFPQIKNDLAKIRTKRPFVLVQFWGGQSPLGLTDKSVYDYENEPLKRHYPVEYAQKVVDLLNEKYDVILYALPNEPKLNNVIQQTIPYLAYYELSKKAVGAITIDSSLAHLITGNCPVLTVWGHSLPENFGYDCNKNLIQNCRRNDILYFTALGASGAKIDYAKPEEVVETFDKMIIEEKK